MRKRSGIVWLLVGMSLLLPHMSAMGYRIVKRRHHKRTAWPQSLLTDFAPIDSPAGRGLVSRSIRTKVDEARLHEEANTMAGLVGIGMIMATNDNSTAAKKMGNGELKCEFSEQFFGPGDPKQKTSCIAIKAAQDAKAANEAQASAGQLAAKHIKQELAERAYQSAKAAEAALTGKQMVLQQLEREMQEANAVVEEESASLQQTEANMHAAVDAACAATQQFEALNELQKTIKVNLGNIHTVALGAQQELSAKMQLLEAARNRLQTLQKQIQIAQDDFEKTKQAAYGAACAALEAKQKAASSSNAAKDQRRHRSHLPFDIH